MDQKWTLQNGSEMGILNWHTHIQNETEMQNKMEQKWNSKWNRHVIQQWSRHVIHN